MTDQDRAGGSRTSEAVEHAKALAGLAAMGFILVCFGGPLLLLAYQGLIWLRDGYWDAWPAARRFAHVRIVEPTVSWAGVQKIITWFFGLPTALALPLIGAASLWLGGVILSPWLRN